MCALNQKLCADLVFHKPDNPRAFIAQALANMQGQADTNVFTDSDLDVRFGMFDRLASGSISAHQLGMGASSCAVYTCACLSINQILHVSLYRCECAQFNIFLQIVLLSMT